jgi:orotidine-5'-phosphate decarboxylase
MLGPVRERLAVALDVADLDAARRLVGALEGVPGWLKVGSELFTAAGPAALVAAREAGRVFLDLKYHDIPNTVAGAVRAATRHGASLLTVHASGGPAMLRAAREAAEEEAAARGTPRPRLVAVTVLTSLGAGELGRVGVAGDVESQVGRLVDLALEAGLDGVVASPQEAARVRRRAGDALLLVTPGVRPARWAADDQTRTAAAGVAIRSGADLIVVGRPVTRAPDPAHAARELLAEIEEALVAQPA